MKRKKVFVTGMSGYVGQCLCRELDRGTYCGKFYGMDVKEPLYKFTKGEFRKMDVNDPALAEWIKEIQPDVIVHLAYVLQPSHDSAGMRKINVDGTKNVLDAAKKAGVKQILVTSSGTAYGAWPDNPVPITEDDPIRRHPGFQYARDKADMEAILAEFVEENPDIITSWVRPCIIYGPNVDNYISQLFTLPIAMDLKGCPSPQLQFVHEDDVVAALMFLLKKEARGPYNLAPPDTMTLSEVNALSGKPAAPLTPSLMGAIFRTTWALGLPILKVPESFLDFVQYPWVLDTSKLMDLGFKYTYSTRETIEIMLRAKGIIP
ncbi:NAD-dependent epimerase/dehydratase [Desulfatibacillum aliphaticivorans]|uniref:NAD-dependent epimerase/dehydratase n=1 Tax=Desulfatibacillum aliphaticivorans TaxID=218208 RepID=B8FAN9_DESAL|nr:SDR family oxidoreductase [Desulfatibacillum aliphaticivorans]ACL03335.1 NAD-dependent epimerase/dehydratase [Desulfatibacillum aliphaticivorans]